MNQDLKYLVHYYSNKDFLFKTITMYSMDEFDDACNSIVQNKTWFMERYRDTDREDYYRRRIFVETQMKTDFENQYELLGNDKPVYFYLVPRMNNRKAIDNCILRANRNEVNKYYLIETDKIMNYPGVTFTIGDSFRSYWKRATEAGIKCRPEEVGRTIFEDHNTIFPITMIERMYEKYKKDNIDFEIQIWNIGLIAKIKNEISK